MSCFICCTPTFYICSNHSPIRFPAFLACRYFGDSATHQKWKESQELTTYLRAAGKSKVCPLRLNVTETVSNTGKNDEDISKKRRKMLAVVHHIFLISIEIYLYDANVFHMTLKKNTLNSFCEHYCQFNALIRLFYYT